VDVRVPEEKSEQRESNPGERVRWKGDDRREENEGPNLSPNTNVDSNIAFNSFAQPGPEKELPVNAIVGGGDTCSIMRTVYGIVRRLVWNVLKPISRKVRVRYAVGGP
jgi:hypothetical protein